MTATHESTARDYEREAEASRHRLADTLSELHDRLTPGDILNEVLSYGRNGGGAFLRAAATAAKQNPIPALLIGTGCAMFMAEKTGLTQHLAARAHRGDGALAPSSGNGRHSAGQALRSAAADAKDTIRQQASSLGEGVKSGVAAVGGTVSEAASSAGNRGASAATSVGDRIAGAATSVGDAAASAAQQVRQGARQAGDKLSDTASGLAESARETGDRLSGAAGELAQGAREIGEAAQEYSSAVGEQIAETAERTRAQAATAARQVKEKAQSLMDEQPLLVAALALAVGAAIAALLPPTKFEDEFLGETSDSVKETLAEVASEQYEKAKDVAGSVAEQAKRVAEQEGLTPASAAGVVRSVGDKVKRVVTESASSAGSELREKAAENKQTWTPSGS